MIIESRFDFTDNRRPDGGNSRKYVRENVEEVIENSQFSVENRQMLGFFGHPNTLLMRENLQNQPSNVCTSLRLNGTIVEHAQQILETDTGKVVLALHKAGAGGWSWRAGGEDGGRDSATTIRELAGFDYVYTPSYTAITESADSRKHKEYVEIREALLHEGLTVDFAEGFLGSLNDRVQQEITRLHEVRRKQADEIQMLRESLARTSNGIRDDLNSRKGMVREALMRTPFKLKDEVMEVLASGVQDNRELRMVLDSLTSYQNVDLQSLPLTENVKTEKVKVSFDDEPPFDFGSIFRH